MPSSDQNLKLYNTLTRTKESFAPIGEQNVRMYVCGPTVYDDAHIGNARPVIVFDVLYRLLRHRYGAQHVRYARNITDVDDKINARAARDYPGLPLNEAIAKVTAGPEKRFRDNALALGCLPPDVEPRATAHLGEMRALIERLVERGVAYVVQDHVLFSPEAMDRLAAARGLPRYGALSRRPLDEMIAGARVDVAPYKKGDADFVLWKPSDDGQPGWPSPAGITRLGRPGWHIECSAMSMATLLEPEGGGLSCDDPEKNVFDIHGGGIDLVFPHHENEVAQSCCAFGTQRMANVWMHNGFLMVEGEKMSKSLGNFVTIQQLLETEDFGGRKWPGEVLRLAMLKTHYRQPIDWTVKALEEAAAKISRYKSLLKKFGSNLEVSVPSPVATALAEDLNTSRALTEIDSIARVANGITHQPLSEAQAIQRQSAAADSLKAALKFLGIDLQSEGAVNNLFDETIKSLIAARATARAAKDFAESDRIRDELLARGVVVKDGKNGTTWEVKPR